MLVGTAGAALGLELDEVIVVGLAEGSFPARRRDDPLLPDRARAVVGPDLPQRSELVHDDHRSLLAAMATAERVTFTFPRGDMRRNAERAPSRWLLDTTEARDGVRPSAERLAASTGDWLVEVPSFVAGLRRTDFPTSVQEYDIRSLLDHTEAGRPFAESAVPAARPEVRTGAELLTARLSSDYTRFDGNLATDGDLRGVVLPDPTGPDQVVSATRLEKWAVCPHAYFVRYVLGVSPVEDPEEQYRISPSPLARWCTTRSTHGSPRHCIREPSPSPALPGPRHRSVICANSPSGGEPAAAARTRRSARLLGRDHQVLLRDLEDFVDFDNTQRAAYSSRPIATELPFGMPGSLTPPVEIPLADGRTLAVRGAIDRVDETPDGTVIVIDYKTGSARSYKDISEDDPTPGGTHLQLVLYSLAARKILQRPYAPSRGLYWFVTAKGGFSTVGYPVRPEIEAATLDTVGRIVDGIAAGHFPAHPAAPGYRTWVDCPYCEPDALGLSHQYADWQRLARHPELADYVDLCGGDRC